MKQNKKQGFLAAAVFMLTAMGILFHISPIQPVTAPAAASDSVTVVIDAGHGGIDPGKIGINGTPEKDLNLSIARKVKAYLTAEDITVVMTRDTEDGLYDANATNKKVQDNLRDGLPYPYTEEDGREYISHMLSADENNTFAFAVTVDDKVIGSIGAFRQSNIHSKTAELGYYIAEEYWGKDIMTTAVKQLCGKIFADTDIIRIYAEPFAYNMGSRRVLEKSGFKLEGIMKSNAVKNGQFLDMALYAITRQETQISVRRLYPEEIQDALDVTFL